jgi:hypothetical protein
MTLTDAVTLPAACAWCVLQVAFVGLDANADAPTCDIAAPAPRTAPAKTPAKVCQYHPKTVNHHHHLFVSYVAVLVDLGFRPNPGN